MGGPYIEFKTFHLNLVSGFRPSAHSKDHRRYYDELWSPSGSLKLYSQIRDVSDRPNPPSGIVRNRAEGYADYRVGRYYLDPSSVKLFVKFDSKAHAEYM